MNWTYIAIAGVLVSIAGLFLLKRQEGIQQSRDEAEFQRYRLEWESFMLVRNGTVRSVKRFANRARFLTADIKSTETLRHLVGFIAIDELGYRVPLGNQGDFDRWKMGGWQDFVKDRNERESDKIARFLESTDCKHWMEYRNVVTGRDLPDNS